MLNRKQGNSALMAGSFADSRVVRNLENGDEVLLADVQKVFNFLADQRFLPKHLLFYLLLNRSGPLKIYFLVPNFVKTFLGDYQPICRLSGFEKRVVGLRGLP